MNLTAAQAAAKWNLSITQVRELCRTGQVDATKVKGRWIIEETNVVETIKAVYINNVNWLGWLKLADLRNAIDALVDGPTREEVDQALTEMFLSRSINLIPEENQKTLTSADREAALVLANEPKHLIAIDNCNPYR